LALFELLFVVGTIALYIKWILIGAAIWAAVWPVRRRLRGLRETVGTDSTVHRSAASRAL
jgi:hypothetical protein